MAKKSVPPTAPPPARSKRASSVAQRPALDPTAPPKETEEERKNYLRAVMKDLLLDPRSVHTKYPDSDRLFEGLIGEAGPELLTYLWNPSPHFAAYLRSSREGAGLSIRQAAPKLGVSPAYISRLETGGYASAPSVERLFKMADLYAVERAEMLTQAGVRVDVPDDLKVKDTTDAEFRAILMDPPLHPTLFTQECLHYVSPRMKRQWIEWGLRLTEQENPREYLLKLIKEGQQ